MSDNVYFYKLEKKTLNKIAISVNKIKQKKSFI